ncbi:hypothetical protein KS878_004547 [Vibrio parahaemolyticus]|nr:hypothetical protein [Vibrio parahaemolyticus]EIZ1340201.1 hypothetical protein [Vibrio parahaemolyticus]
MKISKLIKTLQEIDSTVPFDSDVVTGDDWMPSAITRVYHEPPRTFIEFEDSEEDFLDADSNRFSREWTEQEVAMRQSFIRFLLTNVQNGEASVEDASKYIDLLLDRTLNCGTDAGVEFMRQFIPKS